MFPDLSVPASEVHADGVNTDGTDLEVEDDTKAVTQADEYEKAKALKVTMDSAVAKVLGLRSVSLTQTVETRTSCSAAFVC